MAQGDPDEHGQTRYTPWRYADSFAGCVNFL
jgi:hypothetical protein